MAGCPHLLLLIREAPRAPMYRLPSDVVGLRTAAWCQGAQAAGEEPPLGPPPPWGPPPPQREQSKKRGGSENKSWRTRLMDTIKRVGTRIGEKASPSARGAGGIAHRELLAEAAFHFFLNADLREREPLAVSCVVCTVQLRLYTTEATFRGWEDGRLLTQLEGTVGLCELSEVTASRGGHRNAGHPSCRRPVQDLRPR